MAQFFSHSADETKNVAKRLASSLKGGEIIALRGGMGVGKTTFCAGLAAGLGCEGYVSSPTFAIVNYYEGPLPLAHFDLYRIESQEDLELSGFYDYLDQGAVVVLEWSEKITLPAENKTIYVTFEQTSLETRTITIEGADNL